jgi:hypothetical protein
VVFGGVLLLTFTGSAEEDEPEPVEPAELLSAVKEGSSKMTVHDNATFAGRPETESGDGASPPPLPAQPKASLAQTLRFTSEQTRPVARLRREDSADLQSPFSPLSWHGFLLVLASTFTGTGTWAPVSVAVSPANNMNRTMMGADSLRLQRTTALLGASDLNTTGRSALSHRTDEGAPRDGEHSSANAGPGYDRTSTLNRTAQSNTSRVSETASM